MARLKFISVDVELDGDDVGQILAQAMGLMLGNGSEAPAAIPTSTATATPIQQTPAPALPEPAQPPPMKRTYRRRKPAEAEPAPAAEPATTKQSGWSAERRAKFMATVSAKHGRPAAPIGDARPRYDGSSTPINPRVNGAAARITHAEVPTPRSIAAE